jgi:hypothetical protein
VQNLKWAHDRWGNRTSQTMTWTGSAPQTSYNINTANNQIIGFTYDVPGNITNDRSP